MSGSTFSPAPRLSRPLALAGLLGLSVGLSLTLPSEASALSCDSAIRETLELELISIMEDGAELDRIDGELHTLGELSTLGSSEGEQIRVSTELASLWLDRIEEIEPSAEVEAYIATQSERSSRGLLCSGVPYLAARPGVFSLEPDASSDANGEFVWPEGAVLSLDAARETVNIDFELAEHSYSIAYEVVDFYFPGEEGGCSVSDTPPGPGAALSLFCLLGLGLVRRSRSR